MLLGAARYLKLNPKFDGTTYLIFQPAEETACGAASMIERGLFRDHSMQAVFGIHNWPGLPAGKFAFTAGPIMASTTRVKITFRGKGGHAAVPELAINPMSAISTCYQALQTIITRNRRAHESVVFSITQMQESTDPTVIPDQAWLAGSLRTLTGEALDRAKQRICEIAEGVASTCSCSVDVVIDTLLPATVNDSLATQLCRETLTQWVGPEWIDDNCQAVTGAEDFSMMLEAVPGCYLLLGNGDQRDVEKFIGLRAT